MNIPGIENTVERRLHLIWVIPFVIISFIPTLFWYGFKETFHLIEEISDSLIAVWCGRFYSNKL